MKSLLFLIVFVSACIPENYPITYPPGSRLCRTDYDCASGGYCGFMPGYTAAICRSEGGPSGSWKNGNGFPR